MNTVERRMYLKELAIQLATKVHEAGMETKIHIHPEGLWVIFKYPEGDLYGSARIDEEVYLTGISAEDAAIDFVDYLMSQRSYT